MEMVVVCVMASMSDIFKLSHISNLTCLALPYTCKPVKSTLLASRVMKKQTTKRPRQPTHMPNSLLFLGSF